MFTASSEANGWEATFNWNAYNSTWWGASDYYWVSSWHGFTYGGTYLEFVSVANPTEKSLGIKLGKQWLTCYQGWGIEATDWTGHVSMKEWGSTRTPKYVDFSHIVGTSTNSYFLQALWWWD